MKIMIVDDDKNNRLILQDILTPFGNCDLLINGREAVDLFRMAHDEGAPYDLICLDIMMPDMDGIEALKTIRAIERELGIRGRGEVAIFMVTALSTPADVIHAFYQGGCTDYLPKPVIRQDIVHKLQEHRLVRPV